MTKEQTAFWPTYTWNDNPWIIESSGSRLKASKYNSIRPCAVEELQIQRTTVLRYTMIVPTTGKSRLSQTKFRHWTTAILVNAPSIEVGETLQVQRKLSMRHPPDLQQEYEWIFHSEGRIQGHVVGSTESNKMAITMEQQWDGIHWRLVENEKVDQQMTADWDKLRQSQEQDGLVFVAHPWLHRIPWTVPDTIANQHVVKALKRQPFKRYKGLGNKLGSVVKALEDTGSTSSWQSAIMQQTPKQVWAHRKELTEYQTWVAYRVALRQLNLHHEERVRDNSCRKLPSCQGKKETIEHIFWDCECAQVCWQHVISHWTGETWSLQQIKGYQQYCASRTAPGISKTIAAKLQNRYPDDMEEFIMEWKRMWKLLATISITGLWIQRNRAVFNHEVQTLEGGKLEVWEMGLRQLKAVAKREIRKPDTALRGIRLNIYHISSTKRGVIKSDKSPATRESKKEFSAVR
ncbi:LOW QUALITY PROTEIN: RxLR effector candidate protein [Phytophthora palmivora]|uniref:RxLR effector candidate protein n=1 Tax=Phytophthora palmivora TaxID=4796 RepID=A0A2P4YD14_9STRA|nr:LOW QUALITY PROTEIN: RxLR effector candidate protein [Phytophthora palmivora]